METTESSQGSTGPATRRRGTARAGLLGAAVGIGAVVGGLTLLSGGAGAQPTVADDTTAPAQSAEVEAVEATEGDAEFDAEFESYMACVDGVLAEAGIDVDSDEMDIELSEADWQALEAKVDDCDDLLPAEVLEEWAELDEAYAEYDACLVDHGLIEEFDEDGEYEDGEYDVEAAEPIAFVLVENEDGSTAIEFGDGDGEINLSKVDGEIIVATEGDVASETLNWDELEGDVDDEHFDDDAFEVCDELLGDIEDLDHEDLDHDEYVEDGTDEADDQD